MSKTSSRPKLSSRAARMPASPIRRLVPYALEAIERGVSVYHLNIGQPDIPTPEAYFEALKKFPHKVVEYQLSQGDLDYIKALAGYYRGCGYEVDEKDILVTTGGSEAIIFAMQAVASPGEEILVFEPFYTNYAGYAVMSDVKLVPVTTSVETGYHLPPREEIESKITPQTRAILVCSPNNPTGTVLTREEMQTVAEIALRHDLFVISDEVYREFVYEGTHTGVLDLPEIAERAIIMDSISKRYSVCGARIGCLVSKNRELMDTFLKFGQARLCSPSVEQFAAISLTKLGEDYFEQVREEYRMRRDVVVDALNKVEGVVCHKPSGAFYIMARLPVDDAEKFAKYMLSDFNLDGHTTMVAPGDGFYATRGKGTDEIRIACVLKKPNLEKAMNVLIEGLKQYRLQR
ncbi:MAG: pyridoxal phosphate-dependent aminotransferase [Planctomycetota bacterium]